MFSTLAFFFYAVSVHEEKLRNVRRAEGVVRRAGSWVRVMCATVLDEERRSSM